MKSIILITAIFTSLIASARLTDGKVTTTYKQGQVAIAPLKGFHLNAEAPASATFDQFETKYKPIEKKEQLFTFKTIPGAKFANLNYYVCDDKKTVCEQHQIKFEIATAQISATEKKNVFAGNRIAPLANAEGKPTLLVFSAPWCPACIRMETETYPDKSVSKALATITFKKVNSDLVENFELSEKFHVKAIPTLVLLNAEGEEIHRWLDFQSAKSFAGSLTAETKKLADSSASLIAKASAGDLEAASQLGMRQYNSLNCGEAIKWLSLSPKEIDQKFKLAAEVSCAQDAADEDDKNKEALLKTLEKGIFLSASEVDQIRWFISWLDVKKQAGPLAEDIKTKALQTRKRLREIAGNTRLLKNTFSESTFGEPGGFEKEEVLNEVANIEGLLDLASDEIKTKAQSITLIAKRKLSVDRPGEMLMAIAYLREAGAEQKVNRLYDALTRKYPTTYVYFEKYARYELKNKHLTAALPLSEKAISFADGNSPQLYFLKANILKSMDKKTEAKAIVEQALNLKDIDHPRFKRTLAQLKTLKEELK